MTTSDLDAIEKVLGLRLPAFYRRFVRKYPAMLVGHRARGTKRRIDVWEFANRPDRVIQFNRAVRRAGPLFDGEEWPGGVHRDRQ